MPTYTWYQELIKPTWAPPSWLFGPVWSVLYIGIALSFGYVVYLFTKGRISFFVLLPFLLNIVFNLAFTPIQFGLRNNLLAGVDVLFVLGTLVWAMVVIYPHMRWVTYAQIPYLVWVCFATTLQFTVTYLNK
ncbi:tryptophan-rich sensory protein [Candidatus Campbellbacteria bacterium]|nr:MAG: tryptophan-rich sensory protein [Candidatus Campbellbacteria bacterium]